MQYMSGPALTVDAKSAMPFANLGVASPQEFTPFLYRVFIPDIFRCTEKVLSKRFKECRMTPRAKKACF